MLLTGSFTAESGASHASQFVLRSCTWQMVWVYANCGLLKCWVMLGLGVELFQERTWG